MADGQVAHQRAKLVLVEHLRHQALVADRHDPAPERGAGDPGRFLAAVLEGEQGKVRDPGDVVSRRIDAEDTALVARSISVLVQRGAMPEPADQG